MYYGVKQAEDAMIYTLTFKNKVSFTKLT